MAGLYIHIPFCASRCIYCAFYSSTLLHLREDYTDAICKEINLRSKYLPLNNRTLETIYFGGGTPSQLSIQQLNRIFECIDINCSHKDWKEMEITIECNPDDITEEYAKGLAELPINRVSLGVQTFDDNRLRFLNRRHNSQEVLNVINTLRKNQFANISIDLMFGFPGQSLDEWKDDIRQALNLQTEHISAYSLTIEENTLLERMFKENKLNECPEDTCRDMYYELIDMLTTAGYEHYEISNFAKPSYRSKHNSSYWQSKPYLGIGAAAHSYNLQSRQWNVADINLYIDSIKANKIPAEIEQIDERTKYNDLITTALRTIEGVNLQSLPEAHKAYILKCASPHISSGNLVNSNGFLHLSRQGLYVSDYIMSDLILL